MSELMARKLVNFCCHKTD